jgi:hypothetical protein
MHDAIVDYLRGERTSLIRERYGLNVSQIQEQIWRATQRDAEQNIIGFYALIPRLRVCEPVRRKPLPTGKYPSASQCTSAFRHLLEQEELLESIERMVLKQNNDDLPATDSPKAIHDWLILTLRRRGYREDQYPLSTRRKAYSSLARLIADIKAKNFAENVRANESDTAASNLGVMDGKRRRGTRAWYLDEVEIDEHKLHGIGTIRLTIDGVDKLIPVERPAGIAIVCRGSGSVLGGAISLSVEAREEAVIEAIQSAVIPGYVVKLPNGEPAPPFRVCDFIPELSGTLWSATYLDNAKIHVGEAFFEAIDGIGSQAYYGPLGSWSGRPNIEGAFGRVVQREFLMLASTTGSGPDHKRRSMPAESAIKKAIDLSDVCRCFFEGLRAINTGMNQGLLEQRPVEVLRAHFCQEDASIPRLLPPVSANRPQIGESVIKRRVCRRSDSNHNLYINFGGWKYTNTVLAKRSDLHGEYIIIHVGPNLRTVRAFELCGRELGTLLADGYWGEIDHTREVRRAVQKDKDEHFGDAQAQPRHVHAMLEKKHGKSPRGIKNAKRERLFLVAWKWRVTWQRLESWMSP